jgi:hypothetical protein
LQGSLKIAGKYLEVEHPRHFGTIHLHQSHLNQRISGLYFAGIRLHAHCRLYLFAEVLAQRGHQGNRIARIGKSTIVKGAGRNYPEEPLSVAPVFVV